MTQLEIDIELRGRLSIEKSGGAVRSKDTRTTTAPETGFEQGTLPGTNPEGRFRTSETLGPKLRVQTEYYTRQLEERGIAWLLDDEAQQWLNDLKVVRAHYRHIEKRWFHQGDGGSEDGLYAEVIERIVGKRAEPAYHDEPIPTLDELLDPNCLVMEELANEFPPDTESLVKGNLKAARKAAYPTRARAKVAVARSRCFDRHPEWRRELEARFR
jgi:hypothetical protein